MFLVFRFKKLRSIGKNGECNNFPLYWTAQIYQAVNYKTSNVEAYAMIKRRYYIPSAFYVSSFLVLSA